MATEGPRPRVLYISAHLPYPPWSGGRRRELELIRRLSGLVDFTLCVSSRTPDQDQRHRLAVLRHVERLRISRADGHLESSGQPRQVLERASIPLAKRVDQLLRDERFDLVHVEGYYLVDHLPRHVDIPVLLVEHNVEYELLGQMAEITDDPGSREMLVAEANATRQHEQAAWCRADVCAFVSPEDCATAGQVLGYKPWLLPQSGDHLTPAIHRFDADMSRRESRGDEHEVLFVGNLGYSPSADAACILVHEILPEVSRAVGAVRLALVGSGPPNDLVAAASSNDRIILAGNVTELAHWYHRCSLFVAPLRIGGGTKLKLLEAMAASCAIVTTPVGARGIPGANQAMRVVDVDEAAQATVELLRDEEARRDLGHRARQAFELMPTWEECASRLCSAYRTLSRHDPVSLDRELCGSSAITTLIPSEWRSL